MKLKRTPRAVPSARIGANARGGGGATPSRPGAARCALGMAAGALAAAILAGCASQYKAPVIERAATRPAAARPAPDTRPETYTVRRGDTLYSIALDHGLDYKELAGWNGISDPGVIRAGQVLQLRAPESMVQVRPETAPGALEARPLGSEAPRAAAGALKTEPKAVKLPYSEQNVALLSRQGRSEPAPKAEPKPQPQPAASRPEAPAAEEDKLDWGWPASGKVIAGFSESGTKGVDIGAKIGDPVYASASGRVVYSGTGLRGYGKLIIVKHNPTYLSAYAHNSSILVKEGENVVKGQKIAEVGNSDSDRAMLHFEIRRLGKPMDPLKFLPERPS